MDSHIIGFFHWDSVIEIIYEVVQFMGIHIESVNGVFQPKTEGIYKEDSCCQCAFRMASRDDCDGLSSLFPIFAEIAFACRESPDAILYIVNLAEWP